jgi:hypothetical protein
VFQREATSYAAGLVIVLLSREFALDRVLNYRHPHFKDLIFKTLTSLNEIASSLQHEVSFRINHLYNRHEESAINEGLRFKDWIVEQIKWTPSFASIEYLMSSNDFRSYLKKDLF